jgi:undecaprenyl-diphosphatase
VLGVHWPSDVAGGWAFGALWTLLWLRLAAERRTATGIDSSEQGERS